ncbi:LOW QUALITY PROTEIN: cytosolic 5'-nucleotidase 3-like [Mercenaria mercenaria]|uniref:LOW QUALITY PROTEIN: cytosolic 5'-nucleotidase 3-like n=1 Tax=Mercenaria mercenaria TaxID=6596 RepID=UPI00234EF6F1|nr:LOW QUALITY PROTEIN: cytosolic 5'-nucleotidase 3-like [Mercenaria mercenaria]
MLGFLRRNLHKTSRETKTQAYISLIRSTLEYCSTAWNPHQKFLTRKKEMVQRRARFATNQYHNTSSIEELNRSHVHIRDRDYVMNKLMKMISDGPNKLQVVADFDRTLSKNTHHGNVCATCHNIIEEGGLPEDYKLKAYKIRDEYFPIETDPNMTIEDKIPYMIEWTTQAHNLLLKYPLSKEMLHNMVATSTAKLRDGCTDFFDKLHKCDVPLLIFSAGVGDIIRELISQHSTFYNNMHVVSNDLDFDEKGKVIGFKGEMIHVFNKNENAVHDSDYFSNLSHCTNVLLMGDSLGDLEMANGAENVEAKLTIGFLNIRVADSLELYKSKYDIVICEDESLDVVNAIVNKIIAAG